MVRRVSSRETPLPFAPQLARLVKEPPSGPGWVHEIKFDGYRIGCLVDSDDIRLISRNGLDWTARFPEIVDAASHLPVRQALLDGEVAILDADGRTDFQALQNAFGGGDRRGLVYLVFDLLHLDGDDLARRQLLERKASLERVVSALPAGSPIRFSGDVEANAAAVLGEACRLGLEGIVSKRADAPYERGRAATWVKTKCILRQEFVIGGFTDPEGAREGVGALLVGHHDDGTLRFAGKVGTGFTQASARDIRRRLDALARDRCPFEPRPGGGLARRAHWVEPRLVCEVTFTEWTGDGKIRHPSFQGLREDKPAEAVVRETAHAPRTEAAISSRETTRRAVPAATARAPKRPASAPVSPPARPSRTRGAAKPAGGERPRRPARGNEVELQGVRLTHADRVLYPEEGLTKQDLARYYETVADAILPHLEDRPLTLVRCPTGRNAECFYMKHANVWAPPAVRRVLVPEKTKTGEYLIVDTLPALVSLVQMGVLEIHTWNSRFARLEEPDRLVIDLDPGPKVAWNAVVEAARLVRRTLHAVDLESFVKTTGGRGLHVVVPLEPAASWGECLQFARNLAEALEGADPARYTTAYKKAGRERLILVDYLRNNRTNTSVAAFSTRARPHAPVSVPVGWDELAGLRPESLTARTVPARLARKRRDPWDGYASRRQRLPRGGGVPPLR